MGQKELSRSNFIVISIKFSIHREYADQLMRIEIKSMIGNFSKRSDYRTFIQEQTITQNSQQITSNDSTDDSSLFN